jgi:predicted transcriptional regulator
MQEVHIRKSWLDSHKRDKAAKYSAHKCTLPTPQTEQRESKIQYCDRSQHKAYLHFLVKFKPTECTKCDVTLRS